MPTSWPNSKKCSILDPVRAGAMGALIFVGTFIHGGAHAKAALAPSLPRVSEATLQRELHSKRSHSFASLLKNWESQYGVQAVEPLIKLASQKKNPDSDRYIALMGAAKLGGREIAPRLLVFLKDSSWMLRSGALRALSALNHPPSSRAVLPLLQDPALVVRSEAVDAVDRLHPPGSEEALLRALESRANYHNGKAQWLPQKALKALARFKNPAHAPKLLPLLNHSDDESLLRETVLALETMTGKKAGRSPATANLALLVSEWKGRLSESPSKP